MWAVRHFLILKLVFSVLDKRKGYILHGEWEREAKEDGGREQGGKRTMEED